MRPLVALVAVAGCGRIAFDARGNSGVDAALSCPQGYTRDGASCYRASVGTADWLSAEAACEADGIGAHLAIIDDATEAVIVSKYRSSMTDNAWIGVGDQMIEGAYRTVTNQLPTYLQFASDQPDGIGQNCVMLGTGTDLRDADCASADDYICEYDGAPAVSLAWGVCPAGYMLLGNGCYRFVSSGAGAAGDWFTAEADCEDDAIGAHLVVVSSLTEAQFADQLAGPTTADFFIGATDLVTEGVWVTVANEPQFFLNWDVGEPNNGTTQNCLLLGDGDVLSSALCDQSDDYICEYDGILAVPTAWGQ